MKPSKPNKGFTLVEILVVVFIISLSATLIIVNLRADDKHGGKLDDIGQHLQSLMTLAQEEAILQQTPLGIVIGMHGYAFTQLTNQNPFAPMQWSMLAIDSFFKTTWLPEHITLSLTIRGQPAPLASPSEIHASPQLIFFASGDITPFTLRLIDKKRKTAIQIMGQENGFINTLKLST